ncbi:MAG: HAMP domain-containing sensor histidine kinase [Candidatus Spechtbacterales bacterium]|nr:HAMP domain-containing sensor histidine kinase [Candidatus Spechtbacterales bacterium]
MIPTEKIYLKRLGEWVTKLKNSFPNEPFVAARIKLSAFSAVVLLLLLIIFPAIAINATEYFLEHLLFATFFVFIIITISSYFAYKFVLEPIEKLYNAHKKFIADASHELRTPLSIMKSDIEVNLLDKDSITREELIELLEETDKEIDKMANIIKNLLNISHIDSSRQEMPFHKVNIEKVAKKAIKDLEPALNKKGIYIKTEELKPLVIWANETAVEELIINLLNNAIKHTFKNGNITIKTNLLDNRVILEVIDTGKGIEKDDLPHIFNPFYRGRGMGITSTGSGLGLAIVKDIVQKHKGKIKVESTPRKGTRVIVSFLSKDAYLEKSVPNKKILRPNIY